MSDTVKPVEVLAVAPHPDDAEIFCGGTLAKLSSLGHSVGILDLTEGELSTQGDVVARRTEAAEASKVLGLRWRGNLSLPDGMISAEDSRQIATLVERLRELRPELLLIPPGKARHPDHTSAGALCRKAVFLAGLAKFEPQSGAAHKVRQLACYRMRHEFTPSFICDISEHQAKKMEAIRAYGSQVSREVPAASNEEGGTSQQSDTGPLISSPLSVQSIETFDKYYGAMIACEYAEAFQIDAAVPIADPLSFFRSYPVGSALNFAA